MANYRKPLVAALSMESEQSGCNFFVTDSGEGFFLYTEGGIFPGGSEGGINIETPVGGVTVPLPSGQPHLNPGRVAENNVANVHDGGFSVTPLAGTGVPATNPIVIGAPVGVYGVNANVGPGGAATSASVNSANLGICILGNCLSPL